MSDFGGLERSHDFDSLVASEMGVGRSFQHSIALDGSRRSSTMKNLASNVLEGRKA